MFASFEERIFTPERLDRGEYTIAEYKKWQREMLVIHRVFGEIRALRRSLGRELTKTDGEPVSILEVGAGSGDLIHEIGKWESSRGATLVGSEINSEAASTIRNTDPTGRVRVIQCDAAELPFADGSFDYIFSSLFLHHLDDSQAIIFLKEMARAARKKFYVIDLHRHALAYYFFRVTAPIFFQRFTCEDGALSIRRSFRPKELIRLANIAGIKNAKVTRSGAYRLVLTCSK